MPQMANITIKAANGTTDVVLVAKVPSAGDSSPATWAEDASNTIRKLRPTMSAVSRFNGDRTARRVDLKVSVPIVRVVDTTSTQAGSFVANLSFVVPQDVSDTEANEAVARVVNFASSTLIKAVLSEGYSPT